MSRKPSSLKQPPQLDMRKHHFLIVGEVIYLLPGEEAAHTRRLNGIYVADDKTLNLKALTRAQEVLQLNLHRQMAQVLDTPPDVKDVIIHQLTYLGHFTKSEFQGPQAQELPSN